MAPENWNENGKTWEDDQTLLEGNEIAQLTRADGSDLNGRLHSPVPTQMLSNDSSSSIRCSMDHRNGRSMRYGESRFLMKCEDSMAIRN